MSTVNQPAQGTSTAHDHERGWEFWIDRGGTFTDIVARDPHGRLVTHKLLSDDTASPPRYSDAAIAGIRAILGLDPSTLIPSDRVVSVRMGTTVATNALLERTGERTCLVITKGFADALRIAYQNRPHIFDRHIVLPEMLYERVIEVDERITADGTVLAQPDLRALEPELKRAKAAGIRAVAIVCVHSHAYPAHERAIAELATRIGFDQVSVSAEVSPLMKLIPRGDTTVVDAYLSPILQRYVGRVAEDLPGVKLMFMQSSGGLTSAQQFRGKDAILSGPAGGIVGMARMSELAGHTKVIGFDMGGTSTDVSHYAGEYERVFDTHVAGVRLRAPMLDIHTVAAGGGSVLHFDGSRYRVGPDSAGADPGPACYRNGGPLAVTDANVMLGRIQPAHFPAVFGRDGDQPLDATTVQARFTKLSDDIAAASGDSRTPEQVAAGFLDIAVANMANAVKKISVQKGHDVTEYALTTFGGAGGQHACLVADALGIQTVLVPPMAGVLSALGIGLADTIATREQSVERRLDDAVLPQLHDLATVLAAQARAQLRDEAVPDADVDTIVRAHLRYDGTDTAVPVGFADLPAMTAEFEAVYRTTYSFLMDRPLIVEAIAVEAIGRNRAGDEIAVIMNTNSAHSRSSVHDHGEASPSITVRMYVDDEWRDVPLHQREHLGAGETLTGPAIVTEPSATTVVEDGWALAVHEHGHLVIRRIRRQEQPGITTEADPVLLEIFNNLFMSIAEQMGARLESTAQSVNIKERLDFSCALFDPEGNLIANAPHMPVHLGSMGASVQEVIRRAGATMRPGHVYAVNDPYHGGTHLPDVTVVTPVYDAALNGGIAGSEAPRTLFYVASRGHHAEIGGITPGSMPAFSRDVHEEGVLFDSWLLVVDGRFRESETYELLTRARHPSRNPETNLADLRAQVAANEKGVAEVSRMIDHFGLDVVQAYMRHVQDNAEHAVRRVIDALDFSTGPAPSGASEPSPRGGAADVISGTGRASEPSPRGGAADVISGTGRASGRSRGGAGEYTYEMDSGALIKVRVTVDRRARTATIDFTGSSPQLTTNFNAPTSVATAAILYVFRTLVADDIPINDGCLRPLHIVVPDGSMLAPVYPAAVVAGNVETSQAITGALYAALGVQAEGSGTMNNVTFGNERYQYYETIGSGSGAGDGFDGAAAVQTHMTNSRLTDPEVLESRFPVIVESFVIREGSGGNGHWRGGDGAVRRLRFSEAMTVSTLSGHRLVPPYGLAGGSPGALGRNWVERADGAMVDLAGCDLVDVGPGDVLVIETPGGGGFGITEPIEGNAPAAGEPYDHAEHQPAQTCRQHRHSEDVKLGLF